MSVPATLQPDNTVAKSIEPRVAFLTLPRTGSTMITRQISRHPKAHVVGAIFARKGWDFSGVGQYALKDGLDERWDDLNYRVEHREELIAKFFSTGTAPLLGFKHHLSGDPAVTKTILKDDSIAKIILSRTNLLACYSSNKLALMNQSLPAGADVLTSAIFDAEEFRTYLWRRRKISGRWQSLIEENQNRCLTITYDQARTDAGVQSVMEFLGLPEAKLDRLTKKRNSDNVLSRFSNPEEAEVYLREEGLEDWAMELPADA